MTRSELTVRMHRAGLRLDDAAVAAGIALNCLRHSRDDLMARVRSAGLSYRAISAVFELDVARVYRVLTSGADKSTAGRPTLQSTQD